jgi:hypothetical protein
MMQHAFRGVVVKNVPISRLAGAVPPAEKVSNQGLHRVEASARGRPKSRLRLSTSAFRCSPRPGLLGDRINGEAYEAAAGREQRAGRCNDPGAGLVGGSLPLPQA